MIHAPAGSEHSYLVVGNIEIDVNPGPFCPPEWARPVQTVWAGSSETAELYVCVDPNDAMRRMFSDLGISNHIMRTQHVDATVFHCPHGVCDCRETVEDSNCQWCRTFYRWIDSLRTHQNTTRHQDDAIVAFANHVDLSQWRPGDQLIAQYDPQYHHDDH